MTIKDKLFESLQNDDITGKTIMESIGELFEGEDFTEEFKSKAAAIFESAVVEKAKELTKLVESSYETKFDELESSYEEKHDLLSSIYESKFDELELTFETKFHDYQLVSEAVFEKHSEELNEQVNDYLDYAATTWISENKVAVETGIKNELVEGFIHNLKSVFESSYIDIPSTQVDVVKELTEEVETLKQKLKETVDSTISYKKELESNKRSSIIEEFTTDLTLAEAEKFRELASELSFHDNDKFRSKLHTITEHYFKKSTGTTTVTSPVTDSPVILKEETSNKYIDSSVSEYVSAINRYTK